MANEGAVPQKSEDILHTPYVLEFAGLEDKAAYHESNLESAVIGKMQKFLLELGKGFLFEQRQKRFTFNDKNFYVDLVLYNRLLRCYAIPHSSTPLLRLYPLDKCFRCCLPSLQSGLNWS